VSINTAAVRNRDLIRQSSEAFGSQCTVVAIDAKRRGPGSWEVYVDAGRTPTGLDVLEWAREVEQLGSGEILLTSIDADGGKFGYDIELNAAVSGAVGIPLIASGGAGGPEHIYRALTDGKADAALAASIFHYGQHSIAEVKKYLSDRGVPVRT